MTETNIPDVSTLDKALSLTEMDADWVKNLPKDVREWITDMAGSIAMIGIKKAEGQNAKETVRLLIATCCTALGHGLEIGLAVPLVTKEES